MKHNYRKERKYEKVRKPGKENLTTSLAGVCLNTRQTDKSKFSSTFFEIYSPTSVEADRKSNLLPVRYSSVRG
ncbi:hypothetical protein LEP1GSC058_1438 [Leptospira fainei serovar Hurstbridge str. BUT 6]|uniref:Uncharacterized protein n=1 Tax=Leptospira fainei serovar Hurstbridge str. BUT 6 TaxID=1193011 RepID=S3V4K7_9LEPT|nr:hypothetical protein LEP1GSC058_1438 [Leptospira fainei serovar Hurstbridge str. BUT 6]